MAARSDIEDAVKAAANALATGRAASNSYHRPPAQGFKQRKKVSGRSTVPKSPQFSVMSWQKKMEQGAMGGVGGDRNRRRQPVDSRTFR